MRDDKFWNECNNNSIRRKVAEFIDNSPLLSHYKNKKYYQLEDELVAFLGKIKEEIYREVDKEYHREDVICRLIEKHGEEYTEKLKHIPLSLIDEIVEEWQETLSDDDSHWDSVWNALDDTLKKKEKTYSAFFKNN